MYITVEPLYNEVLALTNSFFFFNFSNRRVLRAIMALGGSTIGFSNLAFPLVFFLLIPLSRLFLRPNPDPAPYFFLRVSCFHYTMFKLTSLLATRSFDV